MLATGDNPQMITSLGVNTHHVILLGVGLSNALVAVSGALVAQKAISSPSSDRTAPARVRCSMAWREFSKRMPDGYYCTEKISPTGPSTAGRN
jgi:hypothetical protein